VVAVALVRLVVILLVALAHLVVVETAAHHQLLAHL